MRKRINQAWMLAGVSFINPEAAYIEAGVQIGADTVIYPNTYLRGKTSIGSGCVIGPDTIITNSQVGSGCTILASVLDGALVENEVEIGPFGRLRKGAHLADHVHMGNFGEVKNSYLGEGTKMGHFSYIGDAEIGSDVNIGCGTITCNFDGKRKFKTKIGNNVFIGSDTMLVAPVTIGENARTGAGAVVTHDVPPDTVVVGVPARPLRKVNGDD
jgi:bifunctional UDP-N-acetylglucosamine pyrophosphorylase/glucosamine-1-phosphate N-acetyltransferase